MADITTWSTWSELVAPATLTMGTTQGRYVWDLTSKLAGVLRINMALLGTTVPGAAIDIRVTRIAGSTDGAADSVSPAIIWAMAYRPTGSVADATINGDVAAGEDHLHVASTTNFAQGDKIVVTDASFDRIEFHELVGTGSGLLYLLNRTVYAHTAAQADTVYDNAGAWDVYIPGGSIVAIVADYRGASTGSNVVWQVLGQTEDYA